MSRFVTDAPRLHQELLRFRRGMSSIAVVAMGLSLLSSGCRSIEYPYIRSVSIAPIDLSTNDRVTAEVIADRSGRRIEYEWLRNGRVIPGAIESSLDLSVPGNGDRGDRIAVRVFASPSPLSKTSTAVRLGPTATVSLLKSTQYYKVDGTDSLSIRTSIRKNELNEAGSGRIALG